LRDLCALAPLRFLRRASLDAYPTESGRGSAKIRRSVSRRSAPPPLARGRRARRARDESRPGGSAGLAGRVMLDVVVHVVRKENHRTHAGAIVVRAARSGFRAHVVARPRARRRRAGARAPGARSGAAASRAARTRARARSRSRTASRLAWTTSTRIRSRRACSLSAGEVSSSSRCATSWPGRPKK